MGPQTAKLIKTEERRWPPDALSGRDSGRAAQRTYAEVMPGTGESPAERVSAAAARTVAAGSARLFAALSTGSPVPSNPDRHSEGMADLAARRTRVSQVMLAGRMAGLASRAAETWLAPDASAGGPPPGTGEGGLARVAGGGPAGVAGGGPAGVAGGGLRGKLGEALAVVTGPMEMLYDGGRAYLWAEDRWSPLPGGDPRGPRHFNDPLWPLDALAGARDDVTEAGPDTVREVAVTRYRLAVDLARADAALSTGVSVPGGPYRALRQLPAEVWLDEAGLVRRAAVVTGLEDRAADKTTWAVAELWDFGVAADITPPDMGSPAP
jgi:hypothetical protein